MKLLQMTLEFENELLIIKKFHSVSETGAKSTAVAVQQGIKPVKTKQFK